MKNFAKRIIRAVSNADYYENETLLVSILALLVLGVVRFIEILFALAALTTLLILLLPFLIYWHFESRWQEQE